MLNTNALNTDIQASLASVIPFPFQESRPQPKTFRRTLDIYLKDSNATGNTYFARYFEWQGILREQWYLHCFPFEWLQTLGGVLVTKYAHQDYVHETFPFQQVECLVNSYEVRQCSFNLLFRFYIDGKLVSRGYQKIVYADRNKKISKFPEGMRELIKEYEDPTLELPE